jgi:hypothetical protein
MSTASILPLFFKALAISIVKIPEPQPKSATSMPSQIGMCSITLLGFNNVSIFYLLFCILLIYHKTILNTI